MRRRQLILVVSLLALIFQACSVKAAPDRSFDREIATISRLLPGTYVGETAGGPVEVSIRAALTHRFVLEAREPSGQRLIQRGELTIMADTRRVALLYRPGVPGRGIDGRPMDEPQGLYLDRSLGAVELVCGLRIASVGSDEAGKSESVICTSSLQRNWRVAFDRTGIEVTRGDSTPPLYLVREGAR